jgi:hypothetical protein
MATSSIAGIGEVERRHLVATGVRALLSTGVLLGAYYLIPLSVHHHGHGIIRDVGAMARLGVAVAVFVVVLTFEIRGITKARHPMLRAGVAMAVVIPLFLVFFAWIYLTMSVSDPATFGGAIHGDRTIALYFTVTVFSTVGFGDITPRTDLARLVTTFQMLADLAVVAVVVRMILGTATRTTARQGSRAATGADDAVPPPPTGAAPAPEAG